MKKVVSIVCFVILAFVGSGQASVVDFDDINTSPLGFGWLGGSYAGFTWFGDGDANHASVVWGVESDSHYMSVYLNSYGSPSGNNAVYNDFGVIGMTVASSIDFDFDGAYFSGLAGQDKAMAGTSPSVTVEGWDNGIMVNSVTMTLSTDKYDWLTANFLSIDTVRIIRGSSSPSWWLMDDFTYNSVSVPEPTTMLLLGLGLVGLAGARMKIQK